MKSSGLPGFYIVICLIVLTAIVGSLFIYLGPKATEKSPGVLHVGVRYSDELSVEFARYGKQGPGARIEFIAEDDKIPYAIDNLVIGRNLVPIVDLDEGSYIARLSASGYQTVEIPMVATGRMLNPAEDAKFVQGTYADYNMIGVRFEPIAKASE